MEDVAQAEVGPVASDEEVLIMVCANLHRKSLHDYFG
jgi:hypothetical protein